MNVSIIKLRFSKPEAERPFRVPWTIGKVPVLPVFGIIFTLVLIASIEGPVLLAGFGVAGLGALIALVFD